jgi:hypothetical protein
MNISTVEPKEVYIETERAMAPLLYGQMRPLLEPVKEYILKSLLQLNLFFHSISSLFWSSIGFSWADRVTNG